MPYTIERLNGNRWIAVCSVEGGRFLRNLKFVFEALMDSDPSGSYRVVRGGNIVTTSERFER